MDDYIWVKCPYGHGEPAQQYVGYCELCPDCGVVMMEIELLKNDAQESAYRGPVDSSSVSEE